MARLVLIAERFDLGSGAPGGAARGGSERCRRLLGGRGAQDREEVLGRRPLPDGHQEERQRREDQDPAVEDALHVVAEHRRRRYRHAAKPATFPRPEALTRAATTEAPTVISPDLRRLIQDPQARPRPSPEDYACALLRAHVLARVGRALAGASAPGLLVKGAALALTVYADAAERPMGDIDLLARRRDHPRVLAALARAGGVVLATPGRPWTAPYFGETALVMPVGAAEVLLELHTSLDKLVPRPIDEAALFSRSIEAPGLPGLRVPAPEDHALLVALHAAGHDFAHPPALLDLELLFRRGLCFDELAARAAEFRLGTVMFIMLGLLREVGAVSITEEHVAAFTPGRLRRAILARRVSAAHLDQIDAASGALGLPWIGRQALLRDDLGAYALGVLRYAAVRVAERLMNRARSPHA
jgi:Uncharacterised nucleotidyltransferase